MRRIQQMVSRDNIQLTSFHSNMSRNSVWFFEDKLGCLCSKRWFSASPASQQCHIFIWINSEWNRISGLQSGDTCLQDRGGQKFSATQECRDGGALSKSEAVMLCQSDELPVSLPERELGAWQQIKTPCCRSITARGHWSRLTVPVHRGRPKYTLIDSVRQDPQQVNSQWKEVFAVGTRPRRFNERVKK